MANYSSDSHIKQLFQRLEYIEGKVYEQTQTNLKLKLDIQNISEKNKNILDENLYLKNELDKQLQITNNLEKQVKNNSETNNRIIDIVCPDKHFGYWVFDILEKFPYLRHVNWSKKDLAYKTLRCSFGDACIRFVDGLDNCNHAHNDAELDLFRYISSEYNSKNNIPKENRFKPLRQIKKKKRNDPNFIPIGDF